MLIGAHVANEDPLAAAKEAGADCVQIFLSNPQSWKAPPPRPDAELLAASDVPIYVHAPYLVNVASANNRIRVPSRRILAETCAAAVRIGAAAVIVHGGHVGEGAELAEGFTNWRKALERLESSVPVYIENTAGGDHAVARRLDDLTRLWEALDGLEVGFCFDTCHAHAAGENLEAVIDRVKSSIGRIDLVHANDSKDPSGSGRDRHENFGKGTIPPDVLAGMVRDAQAPVICETPGGLAAQSADIGWLRARL